jgi:hypothetical protein
MRMAAYQRQTDLAQAYHADVCFALPDPFQQGLMVTALHVSVQLLVQKTDGITRRGCPCLALAMAIYPHYNSIVIVHRAQQPAISPDVLAMNGRQS